MLRRAHTLLQRCHYATLAAPDAVRTCPCVVYALYQRYAIMFQQRCVDVVPSAAPSSPNAFPTPRQSVSTLVHRWSNASRSHSSIVSMRSNNSLTLFRRTQTLSQHPSNVVPTTCQLVLASLQRCTQLCSDVAPTLAIAQCSTADRRPRMCVRLVPCVASSVSSCGSWDKSRRTSL